MEANVERYEELLETRNAYIARHGREHDRLWWRAQAGACKMWLIQKSPTVLFVLAIVNLSLLEMCVAVLSSLELGLHYRLLACVVPLWIFLGLGLFYMNERRRLRRAAAISLEALDATPICCGCIEGGSAIYDETPKKED